VVTFGSGKKTDALREHKTPREALLAGCVEHFKVAGYLTELFVEEQLGFERYTRVVFVLFYFQAW
jgi:hypothetical protein